MAYQLFGREVDVYGVKETPGMIMIDVKQKQGDCPLNLSQLEREVCPRDCGDTFVGVAYSTVERKVIGKSGLIKKGIILNPENIRKHHLQIDMLACFRDIEPQNFYEEETKFTTDVYYKGDLILSFEKCGFRGDDTIPEFKDPEIKKYHEHLIKHADEIIAEFGFIIRDAMPFQLIFHHDSVRSMADLELEGRIRKAQIRNN